MVKSHVDSGKVLWLQATEMILAISQQKKSKCGDIIKG